MILNSPYISGSLTVTGTTVLSGSVTLASGASIAGTSSLATTALTASSVSNLNQNVQITGSLGVTSTITAQTLNVQTVTSSIVYSSGSNIFGNSLSNTQQMTGSLSVTGSTTLTGALNGTSATFSNLVTTTSVYRIVQASVARGGLYTYNQLAGSGTDYSIGIASEAEAFITTGGTATKQLTIASNGAATFSSSITAGSNIALPSGYELVYGTGTVSILGNTTTNVLDFRTSNTPRITINSSGSVGIGTTSTSYAKFNVYNNTNDATYNSKIQAVLGPADYQDSDAIQNYGSGTSETQFLVGSTSRPAMLSLGGNINAGEAVGVINFFRSANTDTYRSRAWVWAGINSTGTANQHGGYLAFSTANDGQTNPQERLRIESGGYVGIGTTTPARKLDVYSDGVQFGDGGSFNFYMNSGPGAATGVTWTMNGTDRLRITPGGDLTLLGGGSISTNGGSFRVRNSGGTASYGLFTTKALWFGGGSTDYTPTIAAETGYGINTYTNGTTSPAGPYVTAGGTSWTNGSSDVRKKKNFETTQGLAEVLQVEPIKYHFNEDDDSSKKRLGFKAQNILPLIPEMVLETGEIAEDGSPYLTVTPDYMLPVLVKAIQEQQTLIESLKARIETLESK